MGVQVVEEEEEVQESITSTLPRHKSTTRLLIHTPIKLTLSPQLRLLPPLWQPLQLWPPQEVLLEVSALVVLPSVVLVLEVVLQLFILDLAEAATRVSALHTAIITHMWTTIDLESNLSVNVVIGSPNLTIFCI